MQSDDGKCKKKRSGKRTLDAHREKDNACVIKTFSNPLDAYDVNFHIYVLYVMWSLKKMCILLCVVYIYTIQLMYDIVASVGTSVRSIQGAFNFLHRWLCFFKILVRLHD